MSEGESGEYLLGSSDSEVQRLRQQHETWREGFDALLGDSLLARGHRALDLGCGPGFTTARLAEIVGDEGEVVGLDRSPKFAQLFQQVTAGHAQVKFHQGEVDDLSGLPGPAKFDFALARWLFCFLPAPESAIDEIRTRLRKGAHFVLLDYRSYLEVGFRPADADLRRGFEAVHAQFAAHGGNLDVGDELPRMLEERGFRCVRLRPMQVLARPGDPHWLWFESFKANHFAGLVSGGFLSADELAAFDVALERARRRPGSFFVPPPVIGIVAELD